MDDLMNDLVKVADDARAAVARIEELQRKYPRARRADLEAENMRLREALEPFAKAARETHPGWDDNRRMSTLSYPELKVKHLRAAAAALNE